MKIELVTYMHGGLSLEIIGETPVEVALLKQIFEHGEMKRGYGKSQTEAGTVTGFFLDMTKQKE